MCVQSDAKNHPDHCGTTMSNRRNDEGDYSLTKPVWMKNLTDHCYVFSFKAVIYPVRQKILCFIYTLANVR